MACGGVPMTEKTWHEQMIRQQHGLAAHSSSFAAPSAGHVSAAGHYGYQPPAQMDHQMTDKENTAIEFHHGMWPAAASATVGGHGSGIGPVGGCLGVRKRGRDEVLFQEFKRRRLTEPEALAMPMELAAPPPAPVAPAPAPVGHEIDTNVAVVPRNAMETEWAPEPAAKPVALGTRAPVATSDRELECRMLRALHGAESYHWAGSAE